ncbi:R3H and coiled-coil domain-containing protein 1 isoform X2 [Nelusetta ayraudi]
MESTCYLPKHECQFMHSVRDELEIYQTQTVLTSVLVFPPLPSRLRYLIHNHVEELPDLCTFSVGENTCRRVVVCHSELRAHVEEDSDPEINSNVCEEPQRSNGRKQKAHPRAKSSSQHRAAKRPDKPLYMPRAARERLSLQNLPEPSVEAASPPLASTTSSKSDSENTNSLTAVGHEHLPTAPHSSPSYDTEQPLLPDESLSPFADLTVREDEEDQELISETLDRDAMNEIKAHLKEPGNISIEHAQNDYALYESLYINFNPEEFGHVIEIYDFPAIFKTDDLLDAFAEHSNGGMKIKWVDNTHALGVFASESAAVQALSVCHPMLKTRELPKGSKKAKAKAMRSAEFIQPVKERPRTDCAVAQRMVTRALGMQRRGKVQRY